MSANRCVSCNCIIPEGVDVCYTCNKSVDSDIRIKKIQLSSFKDVETLVHLASKCRGDVLVKNEKYTVSAKSIMGIYSLCWTAPLKIEFHGDIPKDVHDGLERFVI